MRFTRTRAGISNQHLFHNVDYVVYVEGGRRSYNLEDVFYGKCSDSSTDIAFWRNIFNKYGINKKIKFKSIGSKSTARKIAAEVRDNNISNTIVALDRDYDGVLDNLIDSPKIIYSYGYSWENDLWRKDTILQVAIKLNHFQIIPQEIIEKVNEIYRLFYAKITRHIRVDITATCNGVSYMPKNSGEELLCIIGKLPYVNVKRLKQLLTSINQSKSRRIVLNKKLTIYPEHDCYGKLVRSFGYNVLKWIGSKLKSFKTLSKDMADCLLLSHIESTFTCQENEAFNTYYTNMIQKLCDAI